jgi:ribosomal protein S12 methylthiotransferase accessory factor
VRPLAADQAFTSLADSLPRLEDALSPLVGIVMGTVATTSTPDEAAVPHCACELAPAYRTLGAPTVTYGSGAHPDPLQARAAALGEAIERYSAVYVPLDLLRRTTARELGRAAVPPARFALFHPSQFSIPGFPLAPFTEDTPTTFVEGVDLRDGSAAFLPAELVYLCRPDVRLPPIGYATSSGLACGPTPEEATLGAILELVERDAVMLAWKCRLSLRLLDWTDDPELVEVDARFFEPTGVEYRVIDASCFLGIPVALSVLHGPSGFGAALAVGAAAGARVQTAWLKAIAESFGVYRWLRTKTRDDGATVVDADAIETFDDHMLFYAADEQAALAGFLDASSERSSTTSIPELEGATPMAQVDAIVTRLARHGVSAYAVDVTSPDVRELGVSVVRVIAPELCALDVSHRARFLGGDRLANAAHELGLTPDPLDVTDLNPLPHPFP